MFFTNITSNFNIQHSTCVIDSSHLLRTNIQVNKFENVLFLGLSNNNLYLSLGVHANSLQHFVTHTLMSYWSITDITPT